MPAEKHPSFVIPENSPNMQAYSTLKADADYLQHVRDEVRRNPEVREDDVSKAEHLAYAMKPMMDMYVRLKTEAFESAAKGDKATVDTKMELADKCRSWAAEDGDKTKREIFREEQTPAHLMRNKILHSSFPLLDRLLEIKRRETIRLETKRPKT